MKPFEYTKEWYENEYHKTITDGFVPNPSLFHPVRDLKCMADVGVKPEHKILVCGCGGGDDTWLLTEKLNCHHIWGFDWSQTAVNFFNSFFRDGRKLNGEYVGLPKTTGEAVQACCSRIPYNDNEFDVLLAMDITEHLPPLVYILFLANCYRVLKYGGRIAVLPGMTRRDEHINLMPLSAIREHMKRIGFHIINQKPEWIIGQKNRHSVYSK